MTTLVFLIDVDNTLIDNDNVKNDLDVHLRVEIGPALTDRFWELYEQAREESGVVNIPLALAWLRERTPLSVFDQQGKYAAGPEPANFTPDISVLHIADLMQVSVEQFASS